MRKCKDREGVVSSLYVHVPLLAVCVCAHVLFSCCLWVGWELEQDCQKHAYIHNDVTVETSLL